MWEQLQTHPFFRYLEEIAPKEPSLLLEALWDTPKALLSFWIAKVTGKHLLIVTSNERDLRLGDALAFFFGTPPLLYPSWEMLPGEEMSPNPDIVGRRLSILHTLQSNSARHVVQAPLQAVLQKVCCPSRLSRLVLHWKSGVEVPFEQLPTLLMDLGYQRETVAADKGHFALRGGILDIFPVSSLDPYRIDFFGDTIDKIRTYDPISQRTVEQTREIFIGPADELALLQQETNLSLLLDYLGKEVVIVYDDLLEIENSYVAMKEMPGSQSSLMMTFHDFYQKSTSFQRLLFAKDPLEELGQVVSLDKSNPLEKLHFEIFDQKIETKRVTHPFLSIPEFFWEGKKEEEKLDALLEKGREMEVAFIAASEAEERALKEKVRQTLFPLPHRHTFVRGSLPSGLLVSHCPLVLFPYVELSKRQKITRQKWRNTYHTPETEFHALEKGDLVVHLHNGIGRFLGIETKSQGEGEQEEFFAIEYANQSKLFVPLSQAHLLTRYIGEKEHIAPSLHALGTKQWQKAKAKVEKSILGYAKDLLEIEALREAKGGFSFSEDSDDLLLFEEEFPFAPTEDQLQAIAMIKKDMRSAKAMDRLICGDVGYGKTEVAMRAAFKAVVDGQKQVAVLVPTTVLAMQHYETFVERMSSFPIRIGVISRFVKKKELALTLEAIATGRVDIVIGTHRLIGKDVVFHDLGLLIIDEEQRFGVRTKEHLKKSKIGVDCLTLSATPIPRTLHLSLVGARDISIINTPPQDRLPIKTVLAEREPTIIQNGLLRELGRGGQAYFIHNRVETISRIADEIQKLVPKANVQYVHAQMPPESIDTLFHAFKKGEIDVLVATTIVESGIDMPHANTIFIDRADTFGMADLYQLKGRVGRWKLLAYAYFLVPPNRELAEVSRKRLQALVETSGFGGGMKLAMRDLEIRGAGDLLGVQQSGSVSTVGFHFYCKMLKQTVAKLQHKIPFHFADTKVEVPAIATLPSTYIGETNLRLEIYHRIGSATRSSQIDAIFEELVDRFGSLPIEAKWLYQVSRIRMFGCHHGLYAIKFGDQLTIEQKKGDVNSIRTVPFPFCEDPDLFGKIALELLERCISRTQEAIPK